MSQNQQLGPVVGQGRYLILDALRGFSLMGIILANLSEFALWTFLSADQQAQMPTAVVDRVVRFLQYFLVDGKFYTIVSDSDLAPLLAWYTWN